MTLASGKKRGGVAYGKGALAYLLRNRCYVGEILHKGQVYPADHEPIIDRTTFGAVQASLSAGKVAREIDTKATPFLLQGLLFDSAGNRMTPSHSRKKGVRYRYYISQAVLQSRKTTAGQVARVPASEIEAQIERLVRLRAPDPNGDLRAMVEAQVRRVTIESDAIAVELSGPAHDSDPAGGEACQTIRLPWSKKALKVTKGMVGGASMTPETPAGHRRLLAAIGHARRWVEELLAGRTLAEIAARESKGERQLRLLMPLAFLPPLAVKQLAEGRGHSATVTELARAVPLVWSAPEVSSPPAAACP